MKLVAETRGLTYSEVDQIVRAQMMTQSFAFENAVIDFLGSEQIKRVSPEALARFASQYRLDRMGYGEQIIAMIAEEQERRSQLAVAHSQATADQALTWSKRNALIAAGAAIAAVIAAGAAILGLSK